MASQRRVDIIHDALPTGKITNFIFYHYISVWARENATSPFSSINQSRSVSHCVQCLHIYYHLMILYLGRTDKLSCSFRPVGMVCRGEHWRERLAANGPVTTVHASSLSGTVLFHRLATDPWRTPDESWQSCCKEVQSDLLWPPCMFICHWS